MDREGLNDAALAARLRVVTRSQVYRIRTGDSAARLTTARALEKLTGIPAMDFLTKRAGDPSAKRLKTPEAA